MATNSSILVWRIPCTVHVHEHVHWQCTVHGATKSQTQLSDQHLQFHLLGISKHLNHSTKGSISCPFSKYLLVLWKLWSPTEILSQDDHCLVQRLIPWKNIFINIPEGDHFSSRSSAKFCVFHQLLIFRVNNVTLMLLHIRVYKTITQIFQMFLILLYECVMLGNWKGWKKGTRRIIAHLHWVGLIRAENTPSHGSEIWVLPFLTTFCPKNASTFWCNNSAFVNLSWENNVKYMKSFMPQLY